MKAFRGILHICAYSLKRLARDYRLYLSILMLLIFTHIYTIEYSTFCLIVGEKITSWLYPFLYNTEYVKILFYLPLLFLLCDAPFISTAQPYMMFRCGRLFWCLGQLLYIAVVAGLYFLFLLLISNIFQIGHLEFSTEWGKVLNTLANTDAAESLELALINVKSHTIDFFTPIQATWFTFFLSWLSGIFLGFLIYAINSLSNVRWIGLVAAASFLVMDSVFGEAGFQHVLHFSPVSWSRLSLIDVGGTSTYPSITYIYGAFAVTITLLVVLSIIAGKRQNIEVMQAV